MPYDTICTENTDEMNGNLLLDFCNQNYTNLIVSSVLKNNIYIYSTIRSYKSVVMTGLLSLIKTKTKTTKTVFVT